jgi:hemolysin III
LHLVFPSYTKAERVADRVIHYIGVPLGIVAAIWLLVRAAGHDSVLLLVSTAIYAVGLVGMLASSAAYQLTKPGLLKEYLRRLDRAMIFVMIAGTYTPFSTAVLYGKGGLWLCAVLWALAATGIFLCLKYPRRFERTTMALYLAMGWMMLVSIHECFVLMSSAVFGLVVAGGIIYTIGAVVQGLPKLKFHNPIWHALILLAAALQYAAVSLAITGSVLL